MTTSRVAATKPILSALRVCFLAFLPSTRMVSWLPFLKGSVLPFHMPSNIALKHIFYGLLLGFSLSITSTSIALYYQQRRREQIHDRFGSRPIELRSDEIVDGVTGLIGKYAASRTISIMASSSLYRKHAAGANQVTK